MARYARCAHQWNTHTNTHTIFAAYFFFFSTFDSFVCCFVFSFYPNDTLETWTAYTTSYWSYTNSQLTGTHIKKCCVLITIWNAHIIWLDVCFTWKGIRFVSFCSLSFSAFLLFCIYVCSLPICSMKVFVFWFFFGYASFSSSFAAFFPEFSRWFFFCFQFSTLIYDCYVHYTHLFVYY